MNRRSFLRRVAGGAAGLGAVVLGAKNLGSLNAGDLKEAADEFDDTPIDAKWTPRYWQGEPARFAFINPPYAWAGRKVYPHHIQLSMGRSGDMSSDIEWSDGLTTTHKGFAKLYLGEMPTEYWAIENVLLSEDGIAWLDVHSSARLAANCTGWVWRQERAMWGGYSIGSNWPGDNGAWVRGMEVYTEPPIEALRHQGAWADHHDRGRARNRQAGAQCLSMPSTSSGLRCAAASTRVVAIAFHLYAIT